MALTSVGPALSPCTTMSLSLPWMNALNIADTASRPLCSFCGMSLPDSASGMVV